MRKQTQLDLDQIYNSENMLKGCINRMCVTDDIVEFSRMYNSAISHLSNIFKVNYNRLTETEVQKQSIEPEFENSLLRSRSR